MTRAASSADNFASGCNTTYLWGGISWFSMTVAMAVRSILWSTSCKPSQWERLRCSRACFTSFSTSQETGATRLYHGHWVFSEWQLTQAWANTPSTEGGISAPGNSGVLARSDASCGTECMNTDARIHTRAKLETASPAIARRLEENGLARREFMTVWFMP